MRSAAPRLFFSGANLLLLVVVLAAAACALLLLAQGHSKRSGQSGLAESLSASVNFAKDCDTLIEQSVWYSNRIVNTTLPIEQ